MEAWLSHRALAWNLPVDSELGHSSEVETLPKIFLQEAVDET